MKGYHPSNSFVPFFICVCSKLVFICLPQYQEGYCTDALEKLCGGRSVSPSHLTPSRHHGQTIQSIQPLKNHTNRHTIKELPPLQRCPTDKLCVDISLIYIFNLPVLQFCLSKPIYAEIIAVRPPCFAVCIARPTGNSAYFCCIAFKSNQTK